MTLLEELKALDLASDKPDNIYARVLKYIEELREYEWMYKDLYR